MAEAQNRPPAISTGAVRLSYEQVEVSGGERIGLLGTGLTRDFGQYVHLGLTSYQAVRGQRGGFITLGASGGLNAQVLPRVTLEAGGYLGAGGGADGSLTGGGLFLRGHGGVNFDLGRIGRVGAGASYVETPNGGRISSAQPYFSYQFPLSTTLHSGWDSNYSASRVSDEELRVLGSSHHEFYIGARRYFLSSGSLNRFGRPQADFAQVAVEWRTYSRGPAFVKAELAAGAGGGTAGYMQVLAGGGLRFRISPRTLAHASVALGGGGGGGVDTGGGFLVDSTAALQAFLTPNLFVEAAGGFLAAPTATLRAGHAGLRMGRSFGPAASRQRFSPHASYPPSHLRFRFGTQRYFRAAANWRGHSAEQQIDNLSMQLDYFMHPRWYVSGQAMAAYTGNAGAFMTGLAGAGFQQRFGERWFAGLEGAAGVAGGASVNVGSGIVVQGVGILGVQLSPALSVSATGGEIGAVNGPFRAQVFGMSVGYHFRGFGRK